MSMPPAGWYDDPELVNTRRYWDGQKWTDHRLEKTVASEEQPKASTRACPYCTQQMPVGGTRCPSCSGQLFFCQKDQEWVGAHTKQKWVGMARGGSQLQSRCMKCGRVVAGPRF